MSLHSIRHVGALTTTLLLSGLPAANAQEVDPLALQSAPVAAPGAGGAPGRLYVEGAFGSAQRRYGLGAESVRRLSLDFNQSIRVGSAWSLVLSDRLDYVKPAETGQDSTVNSLREAYATWRDLDRGLVFDLGRVNARYGTAYGYNPTDFFRGGSIRSATSDDPFAQRENRLGTVMLRVQTLWAGGSAAIAVAPKLGTNPNPGSFNADLGSTNGARKALATISQKLSDQVSGQALLFNDRDRGTQFGLSMTALLSSAIVGHVEWAAGSDEAQFSAKNVHRNRVAIGATYTLPTSMALTFEYQFNGFAPDKSAWWQAYAADPAGIASYLTEVQRRQEIASRSAFLIYATQRNAWMKNLDLTGFVKLNLEDHSRLTWVEARYHWPEFDAAIQWRSSIGAAGSEFGLTPRREVLQIVAARYF
jgi:hypothetical protein